MQVTRRPLSIRIDAALFKRLEAHREAMRAATPSSVEVTLRAALEDLIARGLAEVGR